MAKNRNRGKSRGGAQLFERAQRELAKGNVKTAVKDAEACFRQDPRPEHRLLLERAYLGRVEHLHRLRLTAEARAALQKLLDLKPTDPDILHRIPRLQVVVGDTRADAAAVLEQEPGLLIALADQAVLDPRSTAPPNGGVAGHVKRIREALAAVERGDDATAADALRDLPRSSPLVDWKLFVRGLSAFYQGDAERTDANWHRLAPDRPAFRIAQTLLVAAGQIRLDEAKIDVSESVRQFEARIQADPAAAPLKELAEHWRKGDWPAFLHEYRRFRQRFAKTHAPLLARIVDLVWKRAVREDEGRLLERLMAIGPAPPLDPQWQRAWALGCESSEPCFTPRQEIAWQRYLGSLATNADLREEDRAIAAALVHYRLAGAKLRFAEQVQRMSRFGWAEFDSEDAEQFRVEAARRLRQAIESYPGLKVAYRDLAELHEEQEEPKKSAAVLRRLLAIDPDDFDAHVWLANYHLNRNKPAESAPHVEAAERLRPRDRQCSLLRWNQHLAHIRDLAMRRRLDEAKAQVERAAPLLEQGREEPYVLDVMRAALQWKAKDPAAAQRSLEAALEKAGAPAAVWMAMSGAAAEYRLPRAVKKDFDDRFKAAVQERPTSRTAGLLARRLLALKASRRNYTGRATQERLILKCLGRARRVQWTEADLEAACRLLAQFPNDDASFCVLVSIGVKRFPDNAHFHYWRGNDELGHGAYRSDYALAVRHLRRALELARASDRPDDRDLIPLAERALSAAYDAQRRHELAGISWLEDEDDDDYEDDYDDEEFDGGKTDSRQRDRQMDMFDEEDEDGEPIDPKKLLDELRRLIPPEVIEALERAGLGPPPGR